MYYKTPSENRNKVIKFRATEEEYRLLTEKSRQTGTTVSEFARRTIFEKPLAADGEKQKKCVSTLCGIQTDLQKLSMKYDLSEDPAFETIEGGMYQLCHFLSY